MIALLGATAITLTALQATIKAAQVAITDANASKSYVLGEDLAQ